MKKIITFFLLYLSVFCFKTTAQTSTGDCNLQAYFNYQFDPVNHNKVFFVNQSLPAASVTGIKWNFGDGTSSTLMNPDHTYSHAGTYNVCIRITSGTNCVKEYCKTIEIKETEIICADISKFNIIRSTGNCLEFKYIPVTQNPNWKYVWTFGDGTGSNQMIPAGHVYPRSGNYTVTLTVTKSSTCASSSHKIAETGTCGSCNDIRVKYEYRRESASSNKYFFIAVSNSLIVSQRWTITKLNVSGGAAVTLTSNNPNFVFTTPGDYRVCLRAVTTGNCVKEYCETIHISNLTSPCIISSYPNPAHNNVSVSVHLAKPVLVHVYIYNSSNILVKHKEQKGIAGDNVITTNIEDLVAGLYTIKIIYGDKVCYSKFQKL
jgi:PKD repeat protein